MINEHTSAVLASPPADVPHNNCVPSEPDCFLLAPGAVLCREGQEKSAVWRVESGTLCVATEGDEGQSPEIVELAFRGAVLGLGFLTHHTQTITAMVDSRVSVWPRSNLAHLHTLASDIPERQQIAIEREFAYRRRKLVQANADYPLHRVAAFLSAVSRLNGAQGRARDRISDTLCINGVAALLSMDMKTLTKTLAELQARSLVTPDQVGGLETKDLEALERLASENIQLSAKEV